MNQIKLIILIAGVLTLSSAKAQSTDDSKAKEKLPLSLSTYNINVLNLGVKIGIDYPLSEVIKYKVKRNSKSKTVSKLIYLNGSMALAGEETSNTNWLTSIEIGRRRTNNDKWFTAPTLGLGALVKFNKGETWEATEGETTDIGVTSRTYFAPSLGLTVGRNIKLKDYNFGIYGRTNALIQTGLNNTSVPLLSLELGIRCTPSFSISKSLHTIKKKNK